MISLEEQILVLVVFLTIGYATSIFLDKYGIPHVVSYILTGFFISNSFLTNLNLSEDLEFWFLLFENLALGFIGYKIGIELKIDYFIKESKLITILLIGEAGGAFLVVFWAIFLVWGNFLLALLLGGLATATAPAATVEVIRKLKAKGPLTTKMQWLLAFDDVLAIIIVEGILVYLTINFGGTLTFTNYFINIGREIGLAIVMGIMIGLIVNGLLERVIRTDSQATQIIVVFVVLTIGIAILIHTSVILSTMLIGTTVANLDGHQYKRSDRSMEVLINPVIMMFFILIGARVSFADFSPFPWLAIIYLIARTTGVIVGTYLGAITSNVEEKIKNNLGFGLLAQGGVALGLASIANEILSEAGEIELGKLLLTTIVISTIFSELLGSYGTKFAITRAGEVNKLNMKV